MLHIASDSRPGYGDNQDALVMLRHPNEPELLLVAIADGQGGQPGGKTAAQLACQLIVKAASECRPMHLLWKRKWKQLLQQTDQQLRVNASAGFTTLVAFALMPNKLCGAANGDSALMLITPRAVNVLTKGQAKNPPMGSGKAPAYAFSHPLPNPWTVLAMTDGVWKYAGWEQIQNSALNISNPEIMIESIRKNATHLFDELHDDFTLLVLREDGKAKIA